MQGFIGTPLRLRKNALGDFCFGAVFYEALVQKNFKAPMRYNNKTHWAGVYRAHDVRCANVLCTLMLSLVERTGAIYNDKHIE